MIERTKARTVIIAWMDLYRKLVEVKGSRRSQRKIIAMSGLVRSSWKSVETLREAGESRYGRAVDGGKIKLGGVD